jgi:hypothetical protein
MKIFETTYLVKSEKKWFRSSIENLSINLFNSALSRSWQPKLLNNFISALGLTEFRDCMALLF